MNAKKKTNGEYSVAWSDKGVCSIKIAEGLFEEGNAIFADSIREAMGQESPRIFLVADANVVQKTEHLGVKIGRAFSAAGMEIAGSPVILSGGERIKNDDSATVRKIACAAFSARLSRNDVLVAIGGGTIIDVAAYAAAQVRGGMKFAAVPTTVVAAVDSVFMTDAAVDAAGVKDAMRIRTRPSVAFIDANFTKTTLDGVWCGGIGALVRHAATSDGALFKRIVSSLDALKARCILAVVSLHASLDALALLL
jgi:3-dehydroquinate synthase